MKAGAPGAAIVRLDDLTVAYRGHPAVHHLTGEFAAGSLTAIVGPNGAGKSTLLAAIAGGLPPAQGHVHVSGLGDRRIAWLPQRADVDRTFPLRVFDLAALGCWAEVGAFRALDAPGHVRVLRALGLVGLHGFERRLIGELSAGQFQRALFARVMLQDAPLILLDEPFNAVDARTTADLLALIAGWHGEGRTVIAVLHDLAQVRRHFETTLLLARRAVAWGPSSDVLTDARLAEARLSAEAWDEHAPACAPP